MSSIVFSPPALLDAAVKVLYFSLSYDLERIDVER